MIHVKNQAIMLISFKTSAQCIQKVGLDSQTKSKVLFYRKTLQSNHSNSFLSLELQTNRIEPALQKWEIPISKKVILDASKKIRMSILMRVLTLVASSPSNPHTATILHKINDLFDIMNAKFRLNYTYLSLIA
jgi:hypothetical protein